MKVAGDRWYCCGQTVEDVKFVLFPPPDQRENENYTWTDGSAVALLNVRAGAGAPPVKWRRVRAQSRPLLSTPSACVRLARARAFRPGRPGRPSAIHCKSKVNKKIELLVVSCDSFLFLFRSINLSRNEKMKKKKHKVDWIKAQDAFSGPIFRAQPVWKSPFDRAGRYRRERERGAYVYYWFQKRPKDDIDGGHRLLLPDQRKRLTKRKKEKKKFI